jgi:hypothetical protein
MRSQQKLIPGPVEGYKIFNDDMTCTPNGSHFQFQLGRNKLPNNNRLELCVNGFHFCPQPSGVWSYYSSGRVFKVKAYGVLDLPFQPGTDHKLCCEEIEILEEVICDGDGNTGDWNTGDGNTGNWNTGNGNTGDGNTGCHHSGSLNHGEAPLYLFNKLTKIKRDDVPWYLVNRLAGLLISDDEIDPVPFLAIPNATVKAIKKLHQAHIEARRKAKEHQD